MASVSAAIEVFEENVVGEVDRGLKLFPGGFSDTEIKKFNFTSPHLSIKLPILVPDDLNPSLGALRSAKMISLIENRISDTEILVPPLIFHKGKIAVAIWSLGVIKVKFKLEEVPLQVKKNCDRICRILVISKRQEVQLTSTDIKFDYVVMGREEAPVGEINTFKLGGSDVHLICPGDLTAAKYNQEAMLPRQIALLTADTKQFFVNFEMLKSPRAFYYDQTLVFAYATKQEGNQMETETFDPEETILAKLNFMIDSVSQSKVQLI